MIGNEAEVDPWAGDAGLTEAQVIWRERERRQRTVRFLMMFLLMLLFMDGEDQSQRRRSHDKSQLRKRSRAAKGQPLEHSLYNARRAQDMRIESTLLKHPRYKRLINKNKGKDLDSEIRTWAEQQHGLEKDEFAQEPLKAAILLPSPNIKVMMGAEENLDPEEKKEVLHYPWNATGFYRGEWARNISDDKVEQKGASTETATDSSGIEDTKTETGPTFLNATELEATMLDILQERKESSAGVYLLPEGIELKMQNLSVFTESEEHLSSAKLYQSRQPSFLRGAAPNLIDKKQAASNNPHVTLSKNSGRAAFQLYARSVPGIKELSILDGFVKLYDSNTVGYSTRRDILLRVSGVLIHSLGRISLVSSASPGRSALVVSAANEGHHRRLLENQLYSDLTSDKIDSIRDQVLALDQSEVNDDSGDRYPEYDTVLSSMDIDANDVDERFQDTDLSFNPGVRRPHRRLTVLRNGGSQINGSSRGESGAAEISNSQMDSKVSEKRIPRSDVVVPFPFVVDDEDQSVRRTRTPAARVMPPREQLLEDNVGGCEFEISMDIQEEEWTIDQWRTLVGRHVNELMRLHPEIETNRDLNENISDADEKERTKSGAKSSGGAKARRPIQDQALVMTMNGTISSPNCDFAASLNATAIRTDWEHTTGKAINYSFYMMLTCLTQIVLLLRQLLHTQAQSAATRVSLLCIGWQTVLDALLCLVHIYLSLAMQPLFTAFASVAFFKLLIFCVIEMKYMAIIIQARNASNGGNTIELLRRQIAMLHLRFYVALIFAFLVFFYAWESYRTIYILALYSFWVPQIIQNVVTEAKRPLHPYYVYGMSLTRLVAPLYIFAVQNNFLKEVYPESQTNVFMCELLILWVGTQTAILEAQQRYGARFMIPSRFLPPKFDYSRPIPTSILPEGIQDLNPTEPLKIERGASAEIRALTPQETSPRRAAGGTRNRIKGNRGNRTESSMTTETVSAAPSHPLMPTIDCVICYNEIDVRNRRGYMLAPCDHLFHKDCLVQWMDVKMECPICRTKLPAL